MVCIVYRDTIFYRLVMRNLRDNTYFFAGATVSGASKLNEDLACWKEFLGEFLSRNLISKTILRKTSNSEKQVI